MNFREMGAPISLKFNITHSAAVGARVAAAPKDAIFAAQDDLPAAEGGALVAAAG